MKKIIGITGGIGAGKSYVASIFQKLGATIVDADKIAREILEPSGRAYRQVVDAFGKEILKADASIDRKKLAEIVFNNKEQLKLLNSLTHPAVFEEMQLQIEEAETDLVCLDIPLLFSCDFPIPCDATIAVLAPKSLRIERIIARDGCSESQAEARMANQLTDEEMQEKADFCLVNGGDTDALEQKIKEILRQITER